MNNWELKVKSEKLKVKNDEPTLKLRFTRKIKVISEKLKDKSEK